MGVERHQFVSEARAMCIDCRRVKWEWWELVFSTGSGKSSLFYAILGELQSGGAVNIGGSVAVAFQEPWVFSGTVLENIVMSEEVVDKLRY
jgi:ABC-type multidrug transport system fused ATPase/permease subunit